jgi:hypothetical protein
VSDKEEWPSYNVGSKDSIFALGVISANYIRLELALIDLFIAVTGFEIYPSFLLMHNANNTDKLRLLRDRLRETAHPETIKDLVGHFADAFALISENRNKVMHSGLVNSQDALMLFKHNKNVEVETCRVSVEDLRDIADSALAYSQYAQHLSAMIRPREGDIAHSDWPQKPPLPSHIIYKKSIVRR